MGTRLQPGAKGMVSAVELDGVTKRYGATMAADHVSLTAEKGSFTTLLGPSGCGKTTLLRIVAGLETPDNGTVRIGGRDMAGVPIHKRNIGIVFQNYALFPHLSVFENIAFGLRYHNVGKGEVHDRVAAMLDLVRLPGREQARPATLSGGQRQRVALARALVIEPEVLLLDEPLSALDANLRDEMRIELRSIQERLGVTTIFVTHDQGEALAMSDRIAVLRAGSVKQLGAPAELYNRPASPFVGGFLGQTNVIRGELRQTTGEGALAEAPGLGLIEASLVDGGLTPGDPVDIAVRAERLRLDDARRASNSFAGRIAAVDYQGPAARYLIEAGDGHSLYALSFLDGEPLAPGTEITFWFRPEDCMVFACEEQAA